MPQPLSYTRAERIGLTILGAVGVVGINGAFVYALWAQPDALTAALANPVAAAFMVEALVLVGLLAYLLPRWGVSRLGWGWFVILSLLGSLAFAIPVALLHGARNGAPRGPAASR